MRETDTKSNAGAVESTFDVVVVGGGPAGLMAAIAAQTAGASTLVVEKGNRLGRKLGISGGGRCNVTNAKPLPELMKNIPGNSRFLYSALTQFSNTDIIAFFEDLGIRLKEEDRGRVFPVSDRAATVVQALIDHVQATGATVWTDTPVRRLLFDENRVVGVETVAGDIVRAGAVVVASGGCSVPKTGSTGDAYAWARAAGHTIVEPYPTEVPLTSHEGFIRDRTLQGLSLQGVAMTVLDESNVLTVEMGDMIFTHFGLSGPVALRCSHYVSTALRKRPDAKLRVEVDCDPQGEKHTGTLRFQDWFQQERITTPRKQLRNVLLQRLPERLADVILKRSGLDGHTQMANVSNRVAADLARWVTAFPVRLTGTLPLAQATVTGGGVSVQEIQPGTMASRLRTGLYFAGEVMDVHAHTGGYNITVAFSTGSCAGTNAAYEALG